LAAVRYVERNPLKAGIVKSADEYSCRVRGTPYLIE